MYNITIFRDYIYKKPFFTTIFYSFIIFTFFMIPVSAELLEESYQGVDIYSDVNSSRDYSTRYEINTIKETEIDYGYNISWTECGNSVMWWHKFYEYAKPEKMYINFNVNPNLKTCIFKSKLTVNSSFIEGSGFNLMDNGVSVGYGSFFMWADTDSKLLYLYEFDSLDIISGIQTLDVVYDSPSIFNNILNSYEIAFYEPSPLIKQQKGHVTPTEDSVTLISVHYSQSKFTYQDFPVTSNYYDDMATTNTISNLFISENDIYYHYNIDSLIGYVEIDNIQSGYKIGLTHDIYNESTEDNNEYYIFDISYRTDNQQHNNNRELGIKIDLYTDSTINYPEHSFILDYGGIPQTNTGYYGDSGGLNFIRFNPDTFYSANSHQYFDYYVHDTYSEYNFFVTSVILHPNYPQGIEDYQNNVNNTMSGNHILMENEFTFVPNVYKLRLYGTYSYPASVEDGILLAESNPISITAEYVPPTEPPIHPTDPPNGTSINQTLNNSWSSGYYDLVDSTNEMFYLPVYNFISWVVLPITDLTDNMNTFSTSMSDSFSTSSNEIAVLAGSFSIITNSFHPKIINLMGYYLVWLVLLIILRKN